VGADRSRNKGIGKVKSRPTKRAEKQESVDFGCGQLSTMDIASTRRVARWPRLRQPARIAIGAGGGHLIRLRCLRVGGRSGRAVE